MTIICAGPRARECPHDPLCPAGCEATLAPPGPAPPPVRLESLDEDAVRRSIRPVGSTVRKLRRNRGVRPENAGDSASQTDAVLHRVRRIRRLLFDPQCRPTPAVIPAQAGTQLSACASAERSVGDESWVPAFAGMTAVGWEGVVACRYEHLRWAATVSAPAPSPHPPASPVPPRWEGGAPLLGRHRAMRSHRPSLPSGEAPLAGAAVG